MRVSLKLLVSYIFHWDNVRPPVRKYRLEYLITHETFTRYCNFGWPKNLVISDLWGKQCFQTYRDTKRQFIIYSRKLQKQLTLNNILSDLLEATSSVKFINRSQIFKLFNQINKSTCLAPTNQLIVVEVFVIICLFHVLVTKFPWKFTFQNNLYDYSAKFYCIV